MKRNNKLKIILLLLLTLIIIIIILKLKLLPENYANGEEVCNDNRIWLFDKEYPKFDNLNNGQIFVSIASYRDTECSDTIESIFSKAKYPNRIYVGVCEQNKESEYSESCLKSSNLPKGNSNTSNTEETNVKDLYKSHISVYKLDYTEAKGPTYARYFCSTLWNGQQYYLQIDSHMQFEQDWDETLINMYNEAKQSPNSKVVLSAYPPSIEQMNTVGVPIMDNYKVGTNGLPIFYAGFQTDNLDKPIKNKLPVVAAGFLFTESSFLYSVPYDPYLAGLFQGEETLLSVRLYTNGYDSYAPNKKIVSHHYNRTGSLYHNDMKDFSYCVKLAELRVKYILGLIPKDKVPAEFLRSIDKYSLGTTRTINDFYKESKITL